MSYEAEVVELPVGPNRARPEKTLMITAMPAREGVAGKMADAIQVEAESICSAVGSGMTVIDWLVWEVERLRKLEGADDHPEHRCDKCGGRNIHAWYVDADVWSRFAGEYSILCPICFCELVEEAGVENAVWRLSMENVEPEP